MRGGGFRFLSSVLRRPVLVVGNWVFLRAGSEPLAVVFDFSLNPFGLG